MSDNPVNQELEAEKLKAEIDFLAHKKAQVILESEQLALKNRLIEKEVRLSDSEPTEARIFTFWGAVTSSNVGQTIYTLDTWSRQDPGCDITIVFNSPGGAVIDGLALYDFIQDLKLRGHHIKIKVLGHAASMGGVLLQAGDTRVMGSNSLIMIHEVSFGMLGVKVSEAEDETKFAKRLWYKLVDILAARATLSRQSILQRSNRKDWWLDAEEALKYGFIDGIEG